MRISIFKALNYRIQQLSIILFLSTGKRFIVNDTTT